MAKSKQEIIKEIADHFKGVAYSKCYVGITADVQKRLFDDHNVPRKGKDGGYWIHRSASSNAVAREIEKHFLEKGMGGGGGGGGTQATTVYAYKKIPRVTKQ